MATNQGQFHLNHSLTNICRKMIQKLAATTFLMMIHQVLVDVELKQFLTVQVGAGQEECYYQPVGVGETITVDYQVIDTTGEYAKLDIDFRLSQPDGSPVVIEYRRSESRNSFAGGKLQTGDYKFCFDNKFSLLSAKLVYFDVRVENEESGSLPRYLQPSQDYPIQSLEEYQMTAEEVGMQLYNIKQKVLKASSLQSHMLITHGKDRNLADRNIRRIDNMSLVLVVLIIMAGVLQAYMIKQMFTIKV